MNLKINLKHSSYLFLLLCCATSYAQDGWNNIDSETLNQLSSSVAERKALINKIGVHDEALESHNSVLSKIDNRLKVVDGQTSMDGTASYSGTTLQQMMADTATTANIAQNTANNAANTASNAQSVAQSAQGSISGIKNEVTDLVATSLYRDYIDVKTSGSVSSINDEALAKLRKYKILGTSKTSWSTGKIRIEKFDKIYSTDNDGRTQIRYWTDQDFINWACTTAKHYARGYIGAPQKSGWITQADRSGSHRSRTAQCRAYTFKPNLSLDDVKTLMIQNM